jgi:hypothetical protein
MVISSPHADVFIPNTDVWSLLFEKKEAGRQIDNNKGSSHSEKTMRHKDRITHYNQNSSLTPIQSDHILMANSKMPQLPLEKA